MTPASLTLSFDPADASGDYTVAVTVRGASAERMVERIRFAGHIPRMYGQQYMAGQALKAVGNQIAKGNAEWTTEAQNHGLPPHMLRVVNELDDLNTRLDALNSFIGEWPSNLNSKFTALPIIDQTDLLEQQEAMAALAKILHTRLTRARNPNTCN